MVMAAKHYRASYWVAQGVFDGLSAFHELEARIDAVEDPKDRGDIFEIFIEALLETQPIHQCDDHWMIGDIPLAICEEMSLPSDGTGIDGIYRDRFENHNRPGREVRRHSEGMAVGQDWRWQRCEQDADDTERSPCLLKAFVQDSDEQGAEGLVEDRFLRLVAGGLEVVG